MWTRAASATWASLRSPSSAVPTCCAARGDARWREPRRDGVLAGRRASEGLQGGRRDVGDSARSRVLRSFPPRTRSSLPRSVGVTYSSNRTRRRRQVDSDRREAFAYVGDRLSTGPTEYDVAEFIRGRFRRKGLEVTDGPVVAANEHASDPHFEPTPTTRCR